MNVSAGSGRTRRHRRIAMCGDLGRPVRRIDVDVVDVANDRGRRRIGQHHLAIRVPDVALQRRAAANRIEPDRHEPGQRGGDEQRREERRVLQQHADMRRLRRIQPRVQGRGYGSALLDVVAPRRERLLEVHAAVVDVDERCDQRGYGGKLVGRRVSLLLTSAVQAGVSANSRPMRRSWPVAPPTANSVCLAARK